MISDMLSNKNPIVTVLFISRRKWNISLVFITQSYFSVPKNIKQNATNYFVMKIPNKTELQQIPFNHSSDTDFHGLMNLHKKCTAKPYSFLVIDIALTSDKVLHFKKNLVEWIKRLIMAIDDKIRDEKLHYDINRKAAKISALWSGKIDKYEFLTGEEILRFFDQSRIIEQAKVTYSPLGKAF